MYIHLYAHLDICQIVNMIYLRTLSSCQPTIRIDLHAFTYALYTVSIYFHRPSHTLLHPDIINTYFNYTIIYNPMIYVYIHIYIYTT